MSFLVLFSINFCNLNVYTQPFLVTKTSRCLLISCAYSRKIIHTSKAVSPSQLVTTEMLSRRLGAQLWFKSSLSYTAIRVFAG